MNWENGFAHDPKHGAAFQVKYKAAFKKNDVVQVFWEVHNGKKVITMVYGVKAQAYDHALVLKEYLDGL